MRHIENREDARWLGGEAHVHPIMGGPKPAPLARWLSGGVLVLAGIGLDRLAAFESLRPGDATPRNQIGDSGSHQPSERSGNMEQRREEDRRVGSGMDDGTGVVTVLAAFGLGLVAGVAATLLTTPESGASVRNRIKRGMDTARKEFDETVEEAKLDWSAVGDEICDSVKRTASRVKQAAEVTKGALTSCDEPDSTGRRVS
jgi:gas vesicle protein